MWFSHFGSTDGPMTYSAMRKFVEVKGLRLELFGGSLVDFFRLIMMNYENYKKHLQRLQRDVDNVGILVGHTPRYNMHYKSVCGMYCDLIISGMFLEYLFLI